MFQYYHLTTVELRAAERRRQARLEREPALALAAAPTPSLFAALRTIACRIASRMSHRGEPICRPSAPTPA